MAEVAVCLCLGALLGYYLGFPTVTRRGDMHHVASLNVHRQDDGDVVVWIGMPHVPLRDGEREVEFCTISAGGGRSPHTLKALVALIEAIKKDNEEAPIYFTREDGGEVLISTTRIEEQK